MDELPARLPHDSDGVPLVARDNDRPAVSDSDSLASVADRIGKDDKDTDDMAVEVDVLHIAVRSRVIAAPMRDIRDSRRGLEAAAVESLKTDYGNSVSIFFCFFFPKVLSLLGIDFKHIETYLDAVAVSIVAYALNVAEAVQFAVQFAVAEVAMVVDVAASVADAVAVVVVVLAVVVVVAVGVVFAIVPVAEAEAVVEVEAALAASLVEQCELVDPFSQLR